MYKPGVSNVPEVIKEVKPIYADLTKEVHLSKCLHGLTQNANESFNAMIWEEVPKSRYYGISKLKLAVFDAVGIFNYGCKAILDMVKLLNIVPGYYTTELCKEINVTRKKIIPSIRACCRLKLSRRLSAITVKPGMIKTLTLKVLHMKLVVIKH